MSANFCSSESEFQSEKELSVGEKREASVLAPYEIPAKHLEHLHAWLLPIIIAFIVDTVAGCYSGISTECSHSYMLVPYFDKEKSKCIQRFSMSVASFTMVKSLMTAAVLISGSGLQLRLK